MKILCSLALFSLCLSAFVAAQSLTIYFDHDSHHLTAKARQILDQLSAELASSSPLESLSVEGHTDADASENYNAILSQKRAEAVANYLQQRELKQRLFVNGKGESVLLNNNSTEQEKALNRRVVIHRNYQPHLYSLEQRNQRIQWFDVDPEMDTQLKCNQGTEIHIAKGTLDAPNTQQMVRVGICEYYSKADFAATQINTTTIDGELLESAGTIFIQAEQNGQSVEINAGKTIDILFSLKKENDRMQLFEGQANEDQVLWKLADEDFRQERVMDRLNSSNGIPRPVLADVGASESYFLWWRVPDWTRRSKIESSRRALTSSGAFVNTVELDKEEIEKLYESSNKMSNALQSTGLGWINCDRFYSYTTPKIRQEIQFDKDINPSVQIIFTNIRSVMGYCVQNQGSATFSNVPAGEKIVVTAMYQSEDGEILFSMTPATVSKEPIPLEFEVKTEKEIKAMLANL